MNKKLEAIDLFEKILSFDIDLDSWTGLHFVFWCKERNYKNPSFYLFVERYIQTENIIKDIEKCSFDFKSFVNKYLSNEERESFLKYVLTNHYREFQDQTIWGVKA